MLAIILLGTLAATLLVSFLLARRFEQMHQGAKVHCAEKGGDFEVDVVVRPKPWNYGDDADVVRCSALEHPDQVTCDKHCLQPVLTAMHESHLPVR